MDARFANLVEALAPKFERLLAMSPIKHGAPTARDALVGCLISSRRTRGICRLDARTHCERDVRLAPHKRRKSGRFLTAAMGRYCCKSRKLEGYGFLAKA